MTDGQFVVFFLGEEEYAVPISDVKEIINYTLPTTIPSTKKGILGVINLRDKLIPIIDLGSKIGMEMNDKKTTKKIIITEREVDLLGFVVEEVSEVIKIPPGNIEEISEGLCQGKKYLLGVARIDERLLLLIDLIALMKEDSTDEYLYKE